MTQTGAVEQFDWIWYLVQSMMIAVAITGADLTGRLLGWWGTTPPGGLVLPGPGPIIIGFVVVGLYHRYRRRENSEGEQ